MSNSNKGGDIIYRKVMYDLVEIAELIVPLEVKAELKLKAKSLKSYNESSNLHYRSELRW